MITPDAHTVNTKMSGVNSHCLRVALTAVR